MHVGTLRGVTIDVNDLAVAERFWSQVLGLPVLFHAVGGQYSGLGHGPRHEVLLQLVPEPKTDVKNRVHVDVTVEQLDAAVKAVTSQGGRLITGPETLTPDRGPTITYAVMADPFGNEFCLVRDSGPPGPDS